MLSFGEWPHGFLAVLFQGQKVKGQGKAALQSLGTKTATTTDRTVI